MKTIVFILITFSFSYGLDFYRTNSHVVDVQHKLIWQDDEATVKVLRNQADANKYCEDLELDGISDWRLPSVEEFGYIVDKNRKFDEPKIHKAFQYALLDHYWLKDRTWRNFFRWGYYVFLKSGTFYYENNTYPKYIKCVADGE